MTPFDKKDEINELAYGARHFHSTATVDLDSGIHGFLVSGSQGEFWALSREEKKRLFETTVDEINYIQITFLPTTGDSYLLSSLAAVL